MAPTILPLVCVQGGALVRRSGGRWVRWKRPGDESLALIRAFAPDAPFYLYDVDGVEARLPQHEFYQRVEKLPRHPWIDAGCRNPEDAMDAFFAGAEALTIDLEAMTESGLEDLADLVEGEFHIGIRFEARAPRPAIRARELQRLVAEKRASGVLLKPEPSADQHALVGFAKELASNRIKASLLDLEGTLAGPGAAFDHWIRPEDRA